MLQASFNLKKGHCTDRATVTSRGRGLEARPHSSDAATDVVAAPDVNDTSRRASQSAVEEQQHMTLLIDSHPISRYLRVPQSFFPIISSTILFGWFGFFFVCFVLQLSFTAIFTFPVGGG